MSLKILRDISRKLILFFFSGLALRLRINLKLMSYFNGKGYNKLAQLVSNRIQRKFCIFISHKARLSNTVKFPHPTGIVIGDGVIVGEDVVIYQNVTIGGAKIGDGEKNNYPEIGDSAVIFAGAVIVGKIKIGRNCVIGANSVVLNDIPDNLTAVGAPACVTKASLSSANEHN